MGRNNKGREVWYLWVDFLGFIIVFEGKIMKKERWSIEKDCMGFVIILVIIERVR